MSDSLWPLGLKPARFLWPASGYQGIVSSHVQLLVGIVVGPSPKWPTVSEWPVSGSAQPLVGMAVGSSPKWPTVSEWPFSGPAQPLVGMAMGSSPKWPTVNERPLVVHSANSWQLSGWEWAKRWILAFSLGALDQWVKWGAQAGGCVLQGSRALARATLWPWLRPWGGSESLPSPCLCDLVAVAVFLRQSEGPAPTVWVAGGAWGPAGSWAPGSFSDDSWAGLGT